MNTKTLITCALSATLAVVGCVSVDSMRSQLASSDPKDVQKAEQNILAITGSGRDTSGFMKFDVNQQVEYVNIVSDNELLLKIIDKTTENEVIAAAANRLDFSKPGLGWKILTEYDNRNGIVNEVSRALGQGSSEDAERKRVNKKKMAFARQGSDARRGHNEALELPCATGFAGKVVDSMKEDELLQALSSDSVRYERKKDAKNRLISVSQSPDTLASVYDHEINDDLGRAVIATRLAGMADKVTDKDIIVKALNTKKPQSHDCALSFEEKKSLISRLAAQDAEKYALDLIASVYGWEMAGDKGGMDELRSAIYVAASSKDRGVVEKIVLAFGKKVAEGKESARGSTFARDKWSEKDDAKVVELLRSVPLLDAAMVHSLLAVDADAWTYCLDLATEDIAYEVLLSGKSATDKMEEAFLKKLPKNRIDAKLYAGLRFESTRKLALAEMSDEMKKSILSMDEKAFKDICVKAKEAANETFELDGFYLGMSYEDLKVVFSHHFPKMALKEVVDGEGKDADYVFYIDGQKSPVCYASVKDKKVWQINLGKKLLKKWYQFDVQTPMEWACAYSRETKIDMKFKMIEKDTSVYDPTGDTSYRVWFHQESYQYKHNTKEYRLTYFGEEKDFTLEGGLGGDIIKSMAAPRFRYVRGDPGSLRVSIERD